MLVTCAVCSVIFQSVGFRIVTFSNDGTVESFLSLVVFLPPPLFLIPSLLILNENLVLVVMDMAQWTKCLLPKHGDMSCTPEPAYEL